MSVHPSLSHTSTGKGHRNVFKRHERLAILVQQGRWSESQSVFGLPKIKHIKLKAKKKEAKAAAGETAVAGTPQAAATTPETKAPATGKAPAATGKAPAGKAPAA